MNDATQAGSAVRAVRAHLPVFNARARFGVRVGTLRGVIIGCPHNASAQAPKVAQGKSRFVSKAAVKTLSLLALQGRRL